MLESERNKMTVERSGGIEPQAAELEAARSSIATGTVMRGGVYPDLASRFDFWPVNTSNGLNAVIGVAFDPGDRPLFHDVPVDIIKSAFTLALESRQASAAKRNS
jgi:hypothetical protein